jgi:hypothetical protein
MAGNGREWTREVALQPDRFVPQHKERDLIWLRGCSYQAGEPLLFATLEKPIGDPDGPGAQAAGRPAEYIGFRVVIEP